MSPEEKYILLMEAGYTATDKNTYYKLMQKADQVLKGTQANVTILMQRLLNDLRDLPQTSETARLGSVSS